MIIPSVNGVRVVLMASGGMDSTVLAYVLERSGCDVVPVFFDYGQHTSTVELSTLRHVLPPRQVGNVLAISLHEVFANSRSRLVREPDLWRETVVADELILPYRNVTLMSVATAFAASISISHVFSAFINSNHAKEIDATASFLDGILALLGAVGGVRFHIPFRDMSKRDVAREGVVVGAPISETFSCQANSQVHCGACPNCVDRLDALAALRAGG